MIISANGSDYKPVPAGSYAACCVRLVDLGTQISTFNGKAQRKVLVSWEIPDVEVEDQHGDKMPALISSSYTASLHEKATLRKVLESWRGRGFTGDELKGFDLKNVLGAGCMVSIVHEESNNNTYANVAAVMALPKGMPKIQPKYDLINFDLDAFDEATFDKLSPKLREKIATSPEYKAATGGYVPEAGESTASSGDNFPLDDDIPF